MKFTGNTHDIMDGLAIVTRALASKPTKQIFEGVHVQCDGNTLSLTCSDGTMSIRWTGSVAVQEEGEAIIPGKLFSELMRKLPNTTATITTDDHAATITYNKSRSKLSVISGTYPETHPITHSTAVTLPATALKDLITHILPAIATDTARLILTGGLFEVAPDQITAVALDGFRLALKRYSTSTPVSDRVRAVVPRKTLSELSRILPVSDDPVTLCISDDAIQIDVGSALITSTLLAGEYIDYSKIIPQTFATCIRTDAPTFADTLDRACLMAREGKNNLVRLSIADGSITVSSQSETGSVDEVIDCEQQGNNLTIAFNSAYLSEAVRNIPGDTLTVNFNSHTTPAVLIPESGNDWFFLILPVRTF